MHPLVIFTSEKMCGHRNYDGHPECPARLKLLLEMIGKEFPNIQIEDVYPATDDNILLAHPQGYLDYIQSSPAMIDNDTCMNDYSFESALLSAGAAIQATRSVIDGDTTTAFALARPPGHHAEYETAMGFCFFANAFIAARTSGLKTLIVDFDVHHGNGTEDLVKRRVADGHTDIAYISTHQSGIFPHTGMDDSLNICNCPLPRGATSSDFRDAVLKKAIPFAKKFQPELIIFSAGFDGHESDDIAQLNLNHEDFGWIVEQLKPICTRMVSILEGGYNLKTLPSSVNHHLKALAKPY